MKTQNKKLYLKTLAQNMRTYGLKVSGRITKELFSSESSFNKLMQKEKNVIQQQLQKDEQETKLIEQHGYTKGKEMFKAMVKNNSLPANSGVATSLTSSIVQDDPNMKHPSFKSLEAKYGQETALNMIKEMGSDPDFLNKLQQSEKEDAEFKQQQGKEQALKIAQASETHTEKAKPVNKDGVNWDKIDKLAHNKNYDRNNKVRFSKTKGLSGQKLIDQLAHNIECDENACV